MSNYYAGVADIETLRKRYRELVKKHHPDNGGSVSEMQSINAEYDRLFANLCKVNKSDSNLTPMKKMSNLRLF